MKSFIRKRLDDLLDALAEAEQRAFAAEFLAPMIRGGTVLVRIAGIVCRLRVSPADFEGWGIFRSTSATEARLVRQASLNERRQYLDMLRPLRVIACHRDGNGWLSLPANRGDSRFRIDGLVPVRMAEEAELFEVLLTRFDGAHCWYDGPDPRSDPGAAAFLRDAMARMVEPAALNRRGLSAKARAAYELHYGPRRLAEQEASRDRDETRLRAALAHAGAEFREYQIRGDAYRVVYEVDGRRQASVVSRDDLTVQVAGICLSGRDHQFDLKSMVGVLREAEATGHVVRVGDPGGLPEDVYWDVHPPG